MQDEKVTRFNRIRWELETTRKPGEIAQLLAQRLDFTQADLSAATGADWRTVAGWLGADAQASGSSEQREKLFQLTALVNLILEDGTVADDMVDWFRDPNRGLGYRTPLQLIAEGHWKQGGRSLCEEVGIPKAVWPEAFQSEAKAGPRRRKR